MYRILISIIILSLSVSVNAQTDDKSLVRVQKVNGIEVYILNEPLRAYEVLEAEKSGLKAESILTGGLINEGMSGKVNQFVRRSVKSAEKGGYTFDAVLYTGGKDAVAIRFTEEATAENKGLARAKRIGGLYAFVLCEPLADYNVLLTKKGGIKLGSAVTGGLVNKSIEGDFDQLMRRIVKQANKKKQEINGILYTGGKAASGIKFK